MSVYAVYDRGAVAEADTFGSSGSSWHIWGVTAEADVIGEQKLLVKLILLVWLANVGLCHISVRLIYIILLDQDVAPTHPGLIDLEFSGDKDGVDTDGSSCAQNEDELGTL